MVQMKFIGGDRGQIWNDERYDVASTSKYTMTVFTSAFAAVIQLKQINALKSLYHTETKGSILQCLFLATELKHK